jgi:hypothetical protein
MLIVVRVKGQAYGAQIPCAEFIQMMRKGIWDQLTREGL